MSFDNLSGVSPWLSDALCRIATGGGFGTRQLYTDDEEIIFDAMRPIILNGIASPAIRPDLVDRVITLVLPTISDDSRRTERELWAEYERIRPRVLGVLLDAVATGLRRLPSVELKTRPRMADFCEWVVACAPALGIEASDFLDAYAGNRQAATLTVMIAGWEFAVF